MRKKRADKTDNTDDGRVISSMNVDGMPWYSNAQTVAAADSDGITDGDPDALPVKMTARENIAFVFGVLRAALLVSLAFIGGLYLFILFCVNVWFK